MNEFNKSLVIVLFLQILICITSTSVKDTQLSPKTPNETSTSNLTISNNKHHDAPHKVEILTEGGDNNKQIKPSDSSSHFGGREGELILKSTNDNSSTTASVPIISSTAKIEVQAGTPAITSTANAPARPSIPIYENKTFIEDASKNSAHKPISPRKGVNFTDYQLTQNATTVKPKPKKPTVTIAADEQPFMPSHFQPISKSNSSQSQSIPKVPNFEMLNENSQGNTQKYVVPIVIVILSVPFVAILISFLYKRGSEWWKYRHYRRMDFLINGMYDN